jgi:hypothetical protein|tara:strand:+ start:195729 stop:196031 length:303 start_codon:yes stop_codon:yes gene_type:complete
MLTPRLKQSLLLWWAITWRVVPGYLIIGGVLSILWGAAAQLAGIPQLAEIGGKAIMLISSVLVSIYVLDRLLHNGFGKDRQYKLILRDMHEERARTKTEK